MTRNTARVIGASRLALGVLMLCALPLVAQDNNTYIQHARRFAISPPLSELAKVPQPLQYGFHEANPVRHAPLHPAGPVVDTVEQSSVLTPPNYSVGATFLGVGNGFPGYSVPDAPPDTNMAVGDTQIVQWVNVSYTVCSKSSPYTCGPAILGNLIWSSLGGICANNNDGDIIAQWDVVAHRWVLAQNVFTGNYGVCLAVSTSTNANGTYYLYEFPVVNNGFPDYPKWGQWINDWGQTWNNFGTGNFVGAVFCVYNRAKLLAGDHTAEQVCHQYPYNNNTGTGDYSLLPADVDSVTAPPSGEDHFAIGSLGQLPANNNSALALYSAHVTTGPFSATFTGDNDSQILNVASFTSACNGNFGGACVPQKGIPDEVDTLGDRVMYRFAYFDDPFPVSPSTSIRNQPFQHWFVNWTVTASGGNNVPRWMELRAPQHSVPVTSLTLFQQGTYAPDGNHRWMGSIAQDKAGDILLGYSVSCGSTCPGGTSGGVYPSIYIAGRTPSDPLGTLETEVQVIGGTGSQPGTSNRWGDYSAMRIDTNDGMNGCTFWYTQEYYVVTQQFDWSTYINSATFSGCH